MLFLTLGVVRGWETKSFRIMGFEDIIKHTTLALVRTALCKLTEYLKKGRGQCTH